MLASGGPSASTIGATPKQAQALLSRAVDALHADPDKAITAFNTLRGPYSEDDLYVFVVGLNDNRFRANGADFRLVGTDALALRDRNGDPFVQQMISAGTAKNQTEGDYTWPNPVTGNVERKHTYFRKVDDMLRRRYWRRRRPWRRL